MPKILFICSGNVGRSQMAEGFYNFFTKSKDASSAGTDEKTPSKYPEIPDHIVDVMKEEDIDISKNKVKLVTEDMVKKADKIYVMCEKEFCPDFLLHSDKNVFWKIKDPYQMSGTSVRKIRDHIKDKICSIIPAKHIL